MFERFTDRARKVMALANQEAQRFNHEYVGTEHVLLGLVKEGSGVAANVLKNLDVDALLVLRSQIDGQLMTRRSELQKQLARLQRLSADASAAPPNGRTSVMKGVKVKPKYRDPRTGDTWAGRGVQPE